MDKCQINCYQITTKMFAKCELQMYVFLGVNHSIMGFLIWNHEQKYMCAYHMPISYSPLPCFQFDALTVESRQLATVVLMLTSPEEEVLAKACEALYRFAEKCKCCSGINFTGSGIFISYVDGLMQEKCICSALTHWCDIYGSRNVINNQNNCC